MLVIVLSAVIFTTNAEALPDPKVTITYSLRVDDGGTYRQKITETPFDLGNADYVFDTVSSGDPNVTVFVASPLEVTIEYTADAPGGNIVDGPVELTHTHFEREFEIDATVTVTTVLSTMLSRVATGTLSGSTITWDNGVNAYQEDVVGFADCEPVGILCDLGGTWPRDLTDINEVPLPTFTVLTVDTFGDSFVSDNGTPGDPSDDINRPGDNATVKDTWEGMEFVPEPSREILLLAGALGLVGLRRLRECGGAFA
jgi:hypothetical protein